MACLVWLVKLFKNTLNEVESWKGIFEIIHKVWKFLNSWEESWENRSHENMEVFNISLFRRTNFEVLKTKVNKFYSLQGVVVLYTDVSDLLAE